MKRSKFSEGQIAYILRQAEEGTAIGEVCRKAGISEATFYVWRKKYGLMPWEMKRLKQLEEENGKLKKIVADLSLDKAMLQDVLSRKIRGLVVVGSWWTRCAGHGRYRSVELAACCGPTHQRPVIRVAAVTRPHSASGFVRLRRRGCATDNVTLACCFVYEYVLLRSAPASPQSPESVC